MTRIIAVAVPKGGGGKTTTTLNLGAALAEQGQRVSKLRRVDIVPTDVRLNLANGKLTRDARRVCTPEADPPDRAKLR